MGMYIYVYVLDPRTRRRSRFRARAALPNRFVSCQGRALREARTPGGWIEEIDSLPELALALELELDAGGWSREGLVTSKPLSRPRGRTLPAPAIAGNQARMNRYEYAQVTGETSRVSGLWRPPGERVDGGEE